MVTVKQLLEQSFVTIDVMYAEELVPHVTHAKFPWLSGFDEHISLLGMCEEQWVWD